MRTKPSLLSDLSDEVLSALEPQPVIMRHRAAVRHNKSDLMFN